MIGGGGSTANRAAADVIGAAAGRGTCAPTTALAVAIPAPPLALATCDAGRTGDGTATGAASARSAAACSGASPPRKSPTRLSTNWLIEIPLVSQNDLSRSYVTRLTLMLRRVCFFAMISSLRYGWGIVKADP